MSEETPAKRSPFASSSFAGHHISHPLTMLSYTGLNSQLTFSFTSFLHFIEDRAKKKKKIIPDPSSAAPDMWAWF